MKNSGLLLVNKDVGMTSHDCVNIVRRALKTKKVGHTGTLDPMASGLLPICIGKMTKVSELISVGDKEYIAEFTLGITTDTLDITGEVLKEQTPEKDIDKISRAVMSFKGEYMQLPPMYSAKKVNGKKLYELAREGKVIERTPSLVNIKEIELLGTDIDKNRISMRVLCSKGTYIRSLIDDIGEKLGCGACMTALKRTGCAGFSLSDLRTVSIETLKSGDSSEIKLMSPDEMLASYPCIILNAEEEEKYVNGIRLRRNENTDEIYRIVNQKNELIALGRFFEENEGDFRLGVYKSFYGQ